MCENCNNNCDCHKSVDLSKVSKEYLWEQLEAIEDERNKLLDLCTFIVANREEMCIPNTLFLKGDCIDTWLHRVTGQ